MKNSQMWWLTAAIWLGLGIAADNDTLIGIAAFAFVFGTAAQLREGRTDGR